MNYPSSMIISLETNGCDHIVRHGELLSLVVDGMIEKKTPHRKTAIKVHGPDKTMENLECNSY